MPTQRFLNLKESKKNAILEAAANEFARVPYSAVSINQIIKEAEISRGSFYTYFEDKDDLMRYMLRGFRDTLRKKVFEFLEEEEEDQEHEGAVSVENVTGEVKFKLYKGNIIKAGTTSPYSLYNESLASFTTGDMYDHHDADGFITLFGLPLKVRAMKMQEAEKNNNK